MIYFYKLSDELVRVSTKEQLKLTSVLIDTFDNNKEEGWLATLGNLTAHYCERKERKSIWEVHKYVIKKDNISFIKNIVKAYLKERELNVRPFKLNAGTYKMKYVQKLEKDKKDIEYKISDIIQPNATKFWELKEGMSTAALNRLLEDSEDKDLKILELGKKISKGKIPFKQGYPTIFVTNEAPEIIKTKDIYMYSHDSSVNFSSKIPTSKHLVLEGLGTSFEEYFGSLVIVTTEMFSGFLDFRKEL